MNEDNIVIQPDSAAPKDDGADDAGMSDRSGSADVAAGGDDAGGSSASPQVFDFSSDFSISPVKDEPEAQPSKEPFKMPAMKPLGTTQPKKDPINKLENFVEPTAKPQQYREAIDDTDPKKWPFAFGHIKPDQPKMGADKAPMPQSVTATKIAPASPPVKTIRAEESVAGRSIETGSKPVTDLQRDVSAILPNIKDAQARAQLAHAPAQPAAQPDKPTLSQTGDIKSLRTYENDVAEALSHRKSSRASIAIAENKKLTGEDRLGNREEGAPEPEPQAPAADRGLSTVDVRASEPPKLPSHLGKALFYIIASLIIAGGGAWGAYYLYSRSALSVVEKPAQPTLAALSKSIVPADSQTKIAIDGKNAKDLYQSIKSELDAAQSPNTLKDVALTSNASGATKRASADEAATALGIAVPDMIQRTLASDWMLGTYADVGGTKHPFIVAKTNLFQNAFAGMLEWEKTMPKDFKPYANGALPTDNSGRFIDEIVKNKDVRAYVAGPEQNTLFLYSFINNSLIVLSDNEIALAEIVTRLENQAYVR